MNDEIVCRHVSLQPIELLKQAKEMLGEQFWLFVGLIFVGMLIGSAAPLGILMGPMMCGIYLCYMQRSSGKPVGFELMFKGFDYFAESLIATLIMVGVSMLVMIPAGIIFAICFIASMAATHGEAAPVLIVLMPLGYAIMITLAVLVSIPFLFVYPLIVERELKAVPAVKASWAGVKKNFGGVLKLILAYALISLFLAFCLCYIPVFLFVPLSFGAVFLAYRAIFPTTC